MSPEQRRYLASLTPDKRASAIYGLFVPPDLDIGSITVRGGCQSIQMSAAWPEVRAAVVQRMELMDRLADDIRAGLSVDMIESTLAQIDSTYCSEVVPILWSDFERTLALHAAYEQVFRDPRPREPDA